MSLHRWTLLGLALLLPSVALADPKDDARRHFRSGLQAAQEGQYEIALQHFLAAQEAFPHPATLYNIARAYTDLNDLPNALTYYRLYRDAAPEKAPEVDPVIQVLEARMGAPQTPVVVGTPSSSGGGGGQVIVTGPTPEEMARLQAIAAELQALSATIESRAEADRAAAEAAAAAAGGDGDGEGETMTGQEGEAIAGTEGDVDLSELDLPEGGFIGDAYERIVVTASRYGQEPLDSPSTTSVLSAEDIRLMGATNVMDVLRRVAGVDVMAMSSGHSEVSIRGFNRELNNKVLILIDGRSIYWDFVGATLWVSMPITLEDIERIEVIRGPGSAVYGANAVTGVINFITKTPGEEETTLIKYEHGSPNFARGVMTTSGRVGQHAYRFSANYQQVRRWAEEQDHAPGDGFDQQPLLPDLAYNDLGKRVLRLNGRVDRTFGRDGFASLSGGWVDGQNELYNIGALGDYGFDVNHGYIRGDFAYGPLHLRAFWNHNSAFTGYWDTAPGDPHTLDTNVQNEVADFEVEAPFEFDTGPVSHKLNVGAGYRFKYIDFGFIPDSPITEHHLKAFLNEEASIGRLKLVGSLRLDRHPLIPDLSKTLSPRGAAIVRVARNTSVRVTGGTAFRAPNNVESYMDFSLPSSATGAYIRDLGDRNLNPERIITVESGIHDESTNYHQADMVVYYNRVSQLIGLDNVNQGVSFFNPLEVGFEAGTTGWINLPQVYNGFGVEAEAEFYPTDGLDVFVNANVMRIIESTGGETRIDGSSSLFKGNIGAAYRTPFRTDISVFGNYVSQQTWGLRNFDAAGQIILSEETIPGRFTLAARVGVRPFKDEPLEIAFTGWNIAPGTVTGPKGSMWGHREHPEGQPVGSIIYGSVSYEF